MKRTLLILQTILISPVIAYVTFGLMMALYSPLKWIIAGFNWYKRTWYIKSLQRLGS